MKDSEDRAREQMLIAFFRKLTIEERYEVFKLAEKLADKKPVHIAITRSHPQQENKAE